MWLPVVLIVSSWFAKVCPNKSNPKPPHSTEPSNLHLFQFLNRLLLLPCLPAPTWTSMEVEGWLMPQRLVGQWFQHNLLVPCFNHFELYLVDKTLPKSIEESGSCFWLRRLEGSSIQTSLTELAMKCMWYSTNDKLWPTCELALWCKMFLLYKSNPSHEIYFGQ